MAFSPAFLDELNVRNPIEDVVGQYVALTRRGNNRFGLCPFHSEKTPSFSVSPEIQTLIAACALWCIPGVVGIKHETAVFLYLCICTDSSREIYVQT